MTEYKNPTPVVVLLVPVNSEYGVNKRLLTIVRNVEPHIGKMALPGGYVDELETAEIAAARELKEETGLVVNPKHIGVLFTAISPNNRLLIFCDTPEFKESEVQNLLLNDEVSGFGSVSQNDTANLVFPLHQEAADKYFKEYF